MGNAEFISSTVAPCTCVEVAQMVALRCARRRIDRCTSIGQSRVLIGLGLGVLLVVVAIVVVVVVVAVVSAAIDDDDDDDDDD